MQNRQGKDRGSQYQTGVYFTNGSARETVKRIAEMEFFSRLRIDPGDYQKPAAETPISVMCSPAIRSRPTACATASTARPCAEGNEEHLS